MSIPDIIFHFRFILLYHLLSPKKNFNTSVFINHLCVVNCNEITILLFSNTPTETTVLKSSI